VFQKISNWYSVHPFFTCVLSLKMEVTCFSETSALSMHYTMSYRSRQKASYFCPFSITSKITNDITQTLQWNIYSCLTCLKFNKQNSIGLEVLTTVTTKNTTICWDMMPHSVVEVYRHFRGTYCCHLHGCRISQNKHQAEPLCWKVQIPSQSTRPCKQLSFEIIIVVTVKIIISGMWHHYHSTQLPG
jgi:hypothetical protein